MVDNSIEKKKKKKRKINWSEYNESLVRRGEMLFDDGFLQNWRAELKKMNKGKDGPHYRYPNSLISLLLFATVHAYLLPYRQLEGFLRMMSEHIKRLQEIVPDFTSIWLWRVVKMKINLDPRINPEKDDIVIVAVDSTGINVTNRGQWILDKWKQKKRLRKGFIKIHLAVVIKTKKIVSMSVTKEDVHDGKILKDLVDNIKNYNIKKVLADGAYDSKDNFRFLDKMKIMPMIKVRRNSSIRNNAKCIPRKLSVILQLDDIKRWKKRHWYGMRCMVESAFSSIKRTFGEYVSFVKWNNIINDLMLKESIYNTFIDKTMT
ncbi:MAG: IS5 family transposase [Thermoproteota archaeon]|nr:IS5 family transposase [Thermoproteota archaeon]